jgi:hypothetical protein
MVEQWPFKPLVQGSNPCALTKGNLLQEASFLFGTKIIKIKGMPIHHLFRQRRNGDILKRRKIIYTALYKRPVRML